MKDTKDRARRAWDALRKADPALVRPASYRDPYVVERGLAYQFAPGNPLHRWCVQCGTQPAVRGTDKCRHHGHGAGLRGRVRPPRIMAVRAIYRLERADAIPPELARHPAWIAGRRYLRKHSLILRALALGWMAKEEHGHYGAWTQALAQARAAGLVF